MFSLRLNILLTFILVIVTLLGASNSAMAQQTVIYLLSGHGSDERIFDEIAFPEKYDLVYLDYHIPEKNQTMASYAKELSYKIDDSDAFILMGVSLGGMLATEINDIKRAEKVILISSAKTASELPKRYTFMQRFPLYKYLPPKFFSIGARIAQPIVEPDRKSHKSIFVSMLKAKDPLFLKRAVHMIVTWNRKRYADNIIHIHGDKDHTIPFRNVENPILLESGSHMMALTRASDLNKKLGAILK